MQYFTRPGQCQLVGLGPAAALPAPAAGTDAGTPVANSVTLYYSVIFVVDRKLDVLVTTVDAGG